MTGVKSFNEWVTEAIEAQLDHDETLYNDGRQFEAIDPGEIPTGRRS